MPVAAGNALAAHVTRSLWTRNPNNIKARTKEHCVWFRLFGLSSSTARAEIPTPWSQHDKTIASGKNIALDQDRLGGIFSRIAMYEPR
jgi:hypothetical protein